MAANDKIIRMTLLVPREMYLEMHTLSEEWLSSHNQFMLLAMRDRIQYLKTLPPPSKNRKPSSA